MKQFGLIGYPLTHSFSQQYFASKFKKEDLTDCSYENFELKAITDFPALLKSYPDLKGLNVTIPYKEIIIPYMDGLDFVARQVGAVNVIKISGNRKILGFNSDYFGFRTSLENWLGTRINKVKSLILGTGGAARAVRSVLGDCNIPYKTVSRNESKGDYSYFDFIDHPEIVKDFKLIINTTPLGMYPKVNEAPNIPYELLDEHFYLYDLIYNPGKSLFLEKGEVYGTRIKNGLEMLKLQADKSWEIWNN